MGERERFEDLLVVLDDLVEANRDTPIVVEGQRDVAALRALGCAGVVTPLHNGRPLWVVTEELAREGRPVILLTDWDPKGATLLDLLASGLAANGVRADVAFRERIRAGASAKVKDVESLAAYVHEGVERFLKCTLEERSRGLALG